MELRILTQAEQAEHYDDTGRWEDHHWMIDSLLTAQAKDTARQVVAMFDKADAVGYDVIQRYQAIIEELRKASS